MKAARFELDEDKDRENQAKHGVPFRLAQQAFLDARRVVLEDVSHSVGEARHYCIGQVRGAILTVRFTYRRDVIRIFGTGYWRRGKRIYEEQNKIHR